MIVIDVSGWRLDKLGILAALPYLAMGIAVQASGQLADLLRSRFKISTTTVLNSIMTANLETIYFHF